MSSYLKGIDFQDGTVKHCILLTPQNAMSSAVGAIRVLTGNLTISPLGAMGKPCDK